MEAWNVVTGKIPVLWTEATLGAGVERLVYEKWLRWHGKIIRDGLWWPLLKDRSLQSAALNGADGSDNGDVDGSDGSDGGDEDAVVEKD